MKRTQVRGAVAGASLLVALALLAPDAYANPALQVSASHTTITADGAGFSTSGRAVTLYAYGLAGGTKTPLGQTNVTPSTTSQSSPPCILGALCNAGSIIANAFATQRQDPCVSGGFSQVEVDAWTHGPLGRWYRAATARATVACQIVQ